MSYRPYRGSRRENKLKVIIAVTCVVVLFLIAISAFFITQEYLVFTAEGFRFNFPWQQQQEPDIAPDIPDDGTDVPDDEDINIQIEDATPEPQPQPEPEPEPEPEPLGFSIAELFTTEQILTQGVEPPGDFAITVKAPDGVWLLPDDQSSSEVTTSLSQLSEGVHSIAIASAMRDAITPREQRQAAVTTPNSLTWLDYDYISWFSPYSELTADFLISLLDACADAGFSELMLYNFQFPTVGQTDLITFEQDSEQLRVQAISDIALSLSEAAEQRGIAISLLLTQTAGAQLYDGNAGQDVTQLAQYFDKMYVQAETTDDVTFAPLIDALDGTDCAIGYYLSASLPQGMTDINAIIDN